MPFGTTTAGQALLPGLSEEAYAFGTAGVFSDQNDAAVA